MYGLINIKKQGSNLKIKNYGGYESRNNSSIKLAAQALKQIKKDVEFNIYTEDKPLKNINGIKTFSYSTIDNDFSSTCPDFIFDSWKEIGIIDYSEEIHKINLSGKLPYEINKIGWIGSGTDNILARKLLYNFSLHNKDIIDLHTTDLKKTNNGTVTCFNFLNREEQVKKWKYLLDVEGVGYSGRFKFLMWSGRPIFLIDRPYKEYFYEFLEPWRHYIPVKKDLSDLKENFNLVQQDSKLYDILSKESLEFAKKYLSKDFAIEYWKNNIEKI